MVHKNYKTIKIIIHYECRLALVFYLSQNALLWECLHFMDLQLKNISTPLLLIVAFYNFILFNILEMLAKLASYYNFMQSSNVGMDGLKHITDSLLEISL